MIKQGKWLVETRTDIKYVLLQAGDSGGDMLGSVWEFPRSRLRLQTVLGEGNFGKVWKAEADDICGYDGTILVAVKTVKVITQNILAPQ